MTLKDLEKSNKGVLRSDHVDRCIQIACDITQEDIGEVMGASNMNPPSYTGEIVRQVLLRRKEKTQS